MRKNILISAAVMLFATLAFSCKEKVQPVSERIKQIWQPRLVVQGSTTVFSRGGQNNVEQGYSSYRLNLSSAPNVTLTEVDGTSFSGTYVVNDAGTTLTLSGLNPQPTGTDGTLVYTISSFEGEELKLTLNGNYTKTGGTSNTYTLVSN
ncbi:hypothetical protein SAMN06298216_3825 [Spirosomataceae bacterium TFI 002]|nr:hypothetical protein SAMN06298216_3825 [Spirosomataceae bacterium TFI 002]